MGIARSIFVFNRFMAALFVVAFMLTTPGMSSAQDATLGEQETEIDEPADEAPESAAAPPHDLVIKPTDPTRTLRTTPDQPPAGALEETFPLEENVQKSGPLSHKMLNLQSRSADTLETVLPYASQTVLSGPDFTLFGGRYGFRMELRRPRSLPWEAVPPPIDLSGNLNDLQDDPDELDDVLWLPLIQIGFL